MDLHGLSKLFPARYQGTKGRQNRKKDKATQEGKGIKIELTVA